MPVPRWIIGRGLLGSAVARTSRDAPFAASVDWSSAETAIRDLRSAVAHFESIAGDEWEIYWCAGRGVTSTPREIMSAEGDVFDAFAAHVGDVLGASPHGRVFLASSAGGTYAGSRHPPFTESTPPRPLSPYGETKLRVEQTLRRLAAETSLRAFIARITNLYGPGQDLDKAQGLVSMLVDNCVRGRPMSIHASLDTLRDYVYVDDCARIVVAGMTRIDDEPAGTTVVKIIGAMNALSIGAIIGEVSRLQRKRVPLVMGQGSTTGQALDLRVRSEVWRDLDGMVATTLPEGIGAVYRDQLARFMLARRPAA